MSDDVVRRIEAALDGTTPGPWSDRAGCEVYGADGSFIADVFRRPVDGSLIAAAPALLREAVVEIERLRGIAFDLTADLADTQLVLDTERANNTGHSR